MVGVAMPDGRAGPLFEKDTVDEKARQRGDRNGAPRVPPDQVFDILGLLFDFIDHAAPGFADGFHAFAEILLNRRDLFMDCRPGGVLRFLGEILCILDDAFQILDELVAAVSYGIGCGRVCCIGVLWHKSEL